MNESEITIKLAEVALSKARADLLDDIVKIGIPSLIAFAGIVSTFLLTKSNQEKDLSIQEINNTHDLNKEKNIRTGELIKNISLRLMELHANTIKYTSLLFAKIDMEKSSIPFSANSRQELSDNYQVLLGSLHDTFEIEAQIYLLGIKDIELEFAKYQLYITNMHANFSPSTGAEKADELINIQEKIREFRESLFKSLSEAYLVV